MPKDDIYNGKPDDLARAEDGKQDDAEGDEDA